MAGFIASMTARTSFFAATVLAEDPQPGVLLAGATAAADHEPQESGEHEHRKRREEDAEPRGREGDRLRVDRQGAGGLRGETPTHAREQRAGGRIAERRAGDADRDARPPVLAVVGDRSGGL